jgi:hypothetical protein
MRHYRRLKTGIEIYYVNFETSHFDRRLDRINEIIVVLDHCIKEPISVAKNVKNKIIFGDIMS